jgi:hypothetical protein
MPWQGCGVHSLVLGRDVVSEATTDGEELLELRFDVQIGLADAPLTSKMAILSVMAAGVARSAPIDDGTLGLESLQR